MRLLPSGAGGTYTDRNCGSEGIVVVTAHSESAVRAWSRSGWRSAVAPVVVALAVSATPAAAAQPRPCAVDGSVAAATEVGSTLYVGGQFSFIGPDTGSALPLSAASGAVASSYPTVDGQTQSIVADGVGGWFIGGTFRAVGGVDRSNVVHVRADGSVDPEWNPSLDGTVMSIARLGGTVYLAGSFTTVGGAPRGGLAAVDSVTGAVLAWAPVVTGTYASVGVLVADGSTVYLGGYFSAVGGAPRQSLAAVDAVSGAVADFAPNANNLVSAIAVSGSTLYVGGDFTSIGGCSCRYLAGIDASTGAATSWRPAVVTASRAPQWINTIAVSGSTVYVGGEFESVAGSARANLAAIDTATATATAWAPNPDAAVGGVAIDGSTVYAAGYFSHAGGAARGGVVALDAAGAATSWTGPVFRGDVSVVGAGGGTVYAGGRFRLVDGVARTNLAAIDEATGEATAWNPATSSPNDWVFEMTAAGSTLFVGGAFTAAGAEGRSGLAAYDVATAALRPWNPAPDGGVSDLVASGDRVYVAGNFSSVGGSTRAGLAALDTGSGAATAWDPKPSGGSVDAIVPAGPVVYVGGGFLGIGGVTTNGLAELDAASGSARAGLPALGVPGLGFGAISAMTLVDGVLYVGGGFDQVGGLPRADLAAIDTTTRTVTPWAPATDGAIDSLSAADGYVYVAGSFTSLAGAPRPSGVGAIDAATTAAPQDWTAYPTGPSGFGSGVLFATPDLIVLLGDLGLRFVDPVMAGLPAPRPSNLSPPAVTGQMTIGARLTCSDGLWAHGPVTMAKQWFRGTTPVGTGPSYRLVAADAHHPLTCRVTASNGVGPTAAVSAALQAVWAVPTVIVRPKITGSPRVGKLATCFAGTWANVPTKLTFQWLRNGRRIAGATKASYRLGQGDRRKKISCVVKAANPAGAASVTTVPVVGLGPEFRIGVIRQRAPGW